MKRIISILVLATILIMIAGCGGGKKINAPVSSEEKIGTNYEKVYAEFNKVGFKDIRLEPVNTAHKDIIGNVESITIDGKSFKKFQSFSENAQVVIRHYVDVNDNSKVQIKFWKE